MLIWPLGFWRGGGGGGAGIAVDAHSFTDIDAIASPWEPTHDFSAQANLVIVRLGHEQSRTISAGAMVLDPDGLALELVELAAEDVGGQNVAAIWGYWSETPFGLGDATELQVTFSGTAAGSIAISSFTGATKLPTTFDADNGSPVLTLSNSIAIGAGEGEGIILSVFSCNEDFALAPGGDLTEQHENLGAQGGQAIAFGILAGTSGTPLTNPEAPSYTKGGNATRCSMASVLCI